MTFFAETKSVTKSRLHCTFIYCCLYFFTALLTWVMVKNNWIFLKKEKILIEIDRWLFSSLFREGINPFLLIILDFLKCIFWLELYIVSLVISVSSRVTNNVLNMKRSCPQWGFFQNLFEFETILNYLCIVLLRIRLYSINIPRESIAILSWFANSNLNFKLPQKIYLAPLWYTKAEEKI